MSVDTAPPSWVEVRRWFPTLEQRTYINAAGMTPLSIMTHRAAKACLDAMCENVRIFATSYVENLSQARSTVASFYGTDPCNIAFPGTTSMGMSLLAMTRSRVSKEQTTIVTLQDEFPSSTLPWVQQGFELKTVTPRPDHTYDISEIAGALTPGTAAVVASYVQFNTGARVDIPALTKLLQAQNIPLVLNATQAAGIVPIDLRELSVDAMLVSGNKWLMAGPGTATLYVSPRWRAQGFPPVAGWLSGTTMAFGAPNFEITTEARGIEAGLGSLIPIMGLAGALETINEIGVHRIEKRVSALVTWLIDELKKRGADIVTPISQEQRAGIVTVRRSDAEQWVKTCETAGIIVVQRGPGMVRISPHIYNNQEDLEALLSLW